MTTVSSRQTEDYAFIPKHGLRICWPKKKKKKGKHSSEYTYSDSEKRAAEI